MCGFAVYSRRAQIDIHVLRIQLRLLLEEFATEVSHVLLNLFLTGYTGNLSLYLEVALKMYLNKNVAFVNRIVFVYLLGYLVKYIRCAISLFMTFCAF